MSTVKFNWSCPYCKRNVTITNSNYSSGIHSFNNGNKDGNLAINTIVIVCPNDECCEYTIRAFLYKTIEYHGRRAVTGNPIMQWNMKPSSLAKEYPDYVPQAIISDYKEAYLIKDLSPKASATLSRRCLQEIGRAHV